LVLAYEYFNRSRYMEGSPRHESQDSNAENENGLLEPLDTVHHPITGPEDIDELILSRVSPNNQPNFLWPGFGYAAPELQEPVDGMLVKRGGKFLDQNGIEHISGDAMDVTFVDDET
jgi:hypothetical protein